MGKKLLIVVMVGLAVLWWLVRGRDVQPGVVHVGQFLSLNVNDDDDVNIRLSSPDGSTRLRGTLGSDNVVAGSAKSCSSRHEGGCFEMKVTASDLTESLLRLEVAHSGELTRHESVTIVKVKGKKADITLHGNPISELPDVTCHMGSHSVTCHPTQVNAPRLTPAMQAGNRFTYPGGMEG